MTLYRKAKFTGGPKAWVIGFTYTVRNVYCTNTNNITIRVDYESGDEDTFCGRHRRKQSEYFTLPRLYSCCTQNLKNLNRCGSLWEIEFPFFEVLQIEILAWDVISIRVLSLEHEARSKWYNSQSIVVSKVDACTFDFGLHLKVQFYSKNTSLFDVFYIQ